MLNHQQHQEVERQQQQQLRIHPPAGPNHCLVDRSGEVTMQPSQPMSTAHELPQTSGTVKAMPME